MPKVYRSMKKDEDGYPLVDQTGKGLGVRASPVNGVVDVNLDDLGKVVLKGGMPVAPNWRMLPPHLIPRRLRPTIPKASGSLSMFCYTMGTGPFVDGPLADGLDFVRDDDDHGLVVPNQTVTIEEYQTALARTRDLWIIDEA
jgi:hypothetical protein